MTYLNKTLKTSNKQPILEVKDLFVSFQSLVALNNISFTLYENDFIYLVGPNGGGKSTLVKTILNLVKPNSGNIILNTNNIGYLPQNLNTKKNFPITVLEVIYSGFKHQNLFIKKTQQDIVDYWLNKMDLTTKKHEMMSNLSGGQQQRVFLIRALINNPKLLILDEPTSALDPEFRNHFYKLITEIHKNNTTIIFITHDVHDSIDTDCLVMHIDEKIEFFGNILDYKNHHHGGLNNV